MSVYSEYPEVFNIAREQGWLDDAVLHMVLDVISGTDTYDQVVEYMKTVQKEEAGKGEQT